jgi:hypothetical protein
MTSPTTTVEDGSALRFWRAAVVLLVVVSVVLLGLSIARIFGVDLMPLPGARSSAATEQTTCPKFGDEVSVNDPVGLLQKQIADALPCAFDTAYEPVGSKDLVIYLAPLNGHTKTVAEAIIARSPVSHDLTVSLEGTQSFARASEEADVLGRKFGSKLEVSIGYGGALTLIVHNPNAVAPESIVATLHSLGYQGTPRIEYHPPNGRELRFTSCPSVAQWLVGHHDLLCPYTVRHKALGSLAYVAWSVVGAGLAFLVGRHCRRRGELSTLHAAALFTGEDS